ncbi:GntG family PLP-dependent aldolase [Brevibacterium samyangense]|uniref:Low-specificity L-threonine aldolase n=1 Tax=Brevibacterium samyangense TaxID=366888 RepID=A0ABP5ERE5_9MICO
MIDLRSDTLTLPSEEMRTAMFRAEVGDDVYGEDPSINALEERTAELLHQEAGLYCPSGSMTNMLGIAAQVPRGYEALCESQAHIVRAECGSHAALAGVTTRTWVSPDGTFDASMPLSMVSEPRGYNQVGTKVIEVENSHNFGGGRVADIEQLRILHSATRELGVRVHVDGARLGNTVAATGISLGEYGDLADSVSLCLSKGLGAPVGSVLVGDADMIAEARLLRKRYGGGMRQAGILAAGALWALEHNLERLADDNANALRIAEAVAATSPGIVDPTVVETNIVFFDFSGTGASGTAFAEAAAREGVRVTAMSESKVRIVTHLDVSDDDALKAGEILARVASDLLGASAA